VPARTRPGLHPAGRRCGNRISPTPSRRRVRRSLSLRPGVSLSKARAHVRLLGPCYKTGRKGPFRQRRRRLRRFARRGARSASTHQLRPARPGSLARPEPHGHLEGPPRTLTRPHTRADERRRRKTRPRERDRRLAPDASSVRRSLTVSFQRFQALLTPFSGSFSPFLHSTSSLSVLLPYSAWDGINHPL